MEELYIYVVELEDKCYFIHHTSKKFAFEVLLEFEIYYDYLKIHKPIKIIETILEKNEVHLDSVVKEYMYNYGYAYVRGGSYSDIELTNEQEKVILRELTESVRENQHSISYNYIINNYIMREWQSKEEIQTEYNILKQEFEKYKEEKNKKNEIRGNGITEYLLVEIQKMHDFCKIRGKDYTKVTKEYSKLYANVMPKIKHVLKKYIELTDDFATNDSKYAKYKHIYPNYFLEPFFYAYYFSPLSPYATNTQEIDLFFESITYFTNWILCRIQELEYDVNSYKYDIEWLYPRIFYILERSNLAYCPVSENTGNVSGVTD
jgi:hypothetical protein